MDNKTNNTRDSPCFSRMEPTREELIASLAERDVRFAAREAELIAECDNALRVACNANKILSHTQDSVTDVTDDTDDWQLLMSCPSAKTLCGLIMQLNLEVALKCCYTRPIE